MAAVLSLALVAFRRQWRNILVLSLVVGLAGAVVLGAVAGARRTATALGRFEAESHSAHAEISVGDASTDEVLEFSRLDGVAAIGRLRQLAVIHPENENLGTAGALDGTFGEVVDRPRLIAGRRADPSAVDEVAIGEALAEQLDLGIGDRLSLVSFTQEQVDTLFEGGDLEEPAGPPVELRVVGLERRPLDLGARGTRGGVLVTTPAFVREYGDQIGTFNGTILRVRVDDPSDLPRITAAARDRFGDSPFFMVQPLGFDTEGTQDAIDVLTAALWIFAGVAGLAALVAVTIVLSRQVGLAATEQGTLRAVGLTAGQRWLAAAAPTFSIAVSGALIAVAGAALASPLAPFGVAERAEPDPGLHFDWTVLALGGLAVLLVVVVTGALSAWRVTKVGSAADALPRSSSRVASLLRHLPPAPSMGVRMALRPGAGRTAVPVRSAIAGAAAGALGVVAVLTFGSSLDHLATTPARYGWSWDLHVEDTRFQQDAVVCNDVETRLAAHPSVDGLTALCELNLEVAGHPVVGYGFEPLEGNVGPTVVDGRAPSGPDEVALGASDAGDHRQVGGGPGRHER